MLQWRFYSGKPLPVTLAGLVKAAANIGSVIGQTSFGFMGDYFGRKAVYGKELIIIIFATILCISAPSSVGGNGMLIWLSVWRIILGIGVGADYPMSATVTGDRAILRKRGTMLVYIFANQGWGSFVGSVVTMIVLACYKNAMADGNESLTDGIWRIIVGLALIPAFGTLYQRLTLPESKRYIRESANAAKEDAVFAKIVHVDSDSEEGRIAVNPAKTPVWRAALAYNPPPRSSQPGSTTCATLTATSANGSTQRSSSAPPSAGATGTPWQKLFNVATGNLIITALGFVPGYYVSVLTIESLGRKPIQIMGFAMTALMLGILAGKFSTLSHPAFVVLFALLQFFFNFGANTTTFLYPVEVFSTRFRVTAHGISAASGKCGAIIASFGFNSLATSIGTPNVLWIFFAVSLAGIPFTLLPETKGHDPDLVLAQEEAADRAAGRNQYTS